MKKETKQMPEMAQAPTTETPRFQCVKNCMMADTCGANCGYWRPDDNSGKGLCTRFGGYTDYDKWCCSSYYD